MPYRGPILLGEILKFASPIGIRTYNPLVNSRQSLSRKKQGLGLILWQDRWQVRGTAGAYLAGRVADWKLHDEVTEEAPSERSCWRKSAGKSGGGFLL